MQHRSTGLHARCLPTAPYETPPRTRPGVREDDTSTLRPYDARRPRSIAHYRPPLVPPSALSPRLLLIGCPLPPPASYMHRCEMTLIKRCRLAKWPSGKLQRFTGALRACRWPSGPARPNQSCATSAASKQALAVPGAVATVLWVNLHPHASRSR